MPLRDQQLERKLQQQLDKLERTNDAVGPTIVRHRLSELIVQMRNILRDFNQAKYEGQ